MPFEQMGEDEKAYFPRNKETYKLLSSITATDKAQSQPYIRMWRVKNDGSPYNPDKNDQNRPANPISLITMQPPKFGTSSGRYPERPAVSFSKATIKSVFETGPILRRDIVLEFVVHRPEEVFDERNDDYEEWYSIILPGSMYALKYGWTGTSKNDIMNGNGLADKDNQVEGQKTLIITMSRYTFSIQTDGSITFTIFAAENADNILNHLSFGDIDLFDFPDAKGSENISSYSSNTAFNIKDLALSAGYGTGQLKTAIEKTQEQFDKLIQQSEAKHGTTIKLQDILDNIFSPLFERALKSIGFSTINFSIGKFNDNVGLAKKELGGNLSGKSIGEFRIPTSEIKNTLGELRKNGRQLHVYSFFSSIIQYVCSQSCWQRELSESENKRLKAEAGNDIKKFETAKAKLLSKRQVPQIRVRTTSVTKNGKHVIYMHLVDLAREHIKFDSKDRLDPSVPRAQIVEKLEKYNIPLVSFKHGLSYIESSNFSIEQDQNIQAVLISRAVDPSRYQVAKTTHEARAAGTIDPRSLFLSSAIKGRINMIGNFAFETFQMIWLEFGVRRWDGTFYVLEKEDTIDSTGFFSAISFISTGDDPLNTRGILKANQESE